MAVNEQQLKETQPTVILVEPSHPGNIGAVARAMKTMGLSNLSLVRPKKFPHPDAIARASRADDILQNAQIYETLALAIVQCHWIVGITARTRKISTLQFTPRELIQEHVTKHFQSHVAWVFGREQHGLSNEELDLCHAICTIPANEKYSSLNLAAAVQVIAYEWQTRATVATALGDKPVTVASAGELEGLYDHLWSTLKHIDFLDPSNPKPLMRKIRRIFDRTRLTSAEINILRGILKNIKKQ